MALLTGADGAILLGTDGAQLTDGAPDGGGGGIGQPNYALLRPADFEDAVARRLPPRGLAWPRQGGGVFQSFWSGFADVLAAFHARQAVLTETEAWPPTSVELLPRWESVLGLPSPAQDGNPVTAARQAAVAARLASTGGQSIPYYQALAAILGGRIAVTEYAPWRWGVDPFWSPWRNPGWAYVWQVTLVSEAQFAWTWGVSGCWEPWWQTANNPIHYEIQRLAPAHTLVNFTL